ncbi:MAG: gamma carbonic anhydrase family protein [Gemmatimonadales bacterium]|nr:MAG: gamma carbonic anhydrase family protein [Gemmatimonadales bacterium]
MRVDDLTTRSEPTLGPGVWIAPGAVVIGDVELEADASVWFGCVLRGDIASIRIGQRTNIQDLSVVHVETAQPCDIGSDVGVGHRAIIHGCRIGDGCLIGMGAVVLSHAVIGEDSVIGAGAVVREGMVVPPHSLVVGVPGRIVREVDGELLERARLTVANYLMLKEAHRAGRWRQNST